MNRSRVLLLPAVLVTAALLLSAARATAQEVGLAPLDVKEVARGYRAEALKLKPIANEKSQVLGKISDFIFSKDGVRIMIMMCSNRGYSESSLNFSLASLNSSL